MHGFIPYGVYWSTPFAKWQGSLANLNSVRLAAHVGRQVLADKRVPLDQIDLGILGMTNPQKGSFYGLPWLTGMLGIDRVAGPTVQQACATSVRALQMASQELAGGTATCALLVMCDRMSNGPIVHYPDATAPGGNGITERWTLDNFAADPYAGQTYAVYRAAERTGELAGAARQFTSCPWRAWQASTLPVKGMEMAVQGVQVFHAGHGGRGSVPR